MRDGLENVLCFLRETYHCRLGEERSILQRTCTAWPPCCSGGSPLHSWRSRKSCSWISPKGCKPDVHAQDVSVPDRSQLKKENKSVLLLSHPVTRGKNPGNQNYQSVQLLSRIQLFTTPWTAARQASLSITNSRSPPKPMSIMLVMPSSHLILHHPLLLLPSIFPSIGVFSNESALWIRWPKYWSFRFSISPNNDHPGLISLGWTGWISLQSKGLYYLSNVRHKASQVALVVKNLPANAGDKRDLGSIPGSGRSPGGRHSNPFQYSCLENPMDRGTWQATVHRVAVSHTWLKRLSKKRHYENVMSAFVHIIQTISLRLILYCPCFTVRTWHLRVYLCCQGAITTKW